MTVAYLAQGTLVQIGDAGSPESFSTIPDVLDIDGPNEVADELEVTSHSSANATKEFIQALRDTGDVSFDINLDYNEANHALLKTLYGSGAVRNFQIIIPSSPTATLSFAAFVKEFGHSFPVAEQARASVVLRITSTLTVS